MVIESVTFGLRFKKKHEIFILPSHEFRIRVKLFSRHEEIHIKLFQSTYEEEEKRFTNRIAIVHPPDVQRLTGNRLRRRSRWEQGAFRKKFRFK